MNKKYKKMLKPFRGLLKIFDISILRFSNYQRYSNPQILDLDFGASNMCAKPCPKGREELIHLTLMY